MNNSSAGPCCCTSAGQALLWQRHRQLFWSTDEAQASVVLLQNYKCHDMQKVAGQPTQEETANGKGVIFTTGAKLMCSDLTSRLGSSPSSKKCAHRSTKRYKTAGKTQII